MKRQKKVIRRDPRQVGGRYFCGYWRQEYTVLAMELEPLGVYGRWTVEWADGHRTTHSTAWDWRHDRIISVPADAGA